jgi:hypothetical protein
MSIKLDHDQLRLIRAVHNFPKVREMAMSSDLGMLVLIVGALAMFAGVLGWASWEETRARRRNERQSGL